MPSHRTAHSLVLPLPRRAPIYFGALWVLTFAFGFIIASIPGALSAQLGLDRALNDAHSPLLDAVAKTLDKLDSVTVVAAFIVVLVVVVGLSSSWWRGIAAAFVAGGGWLLCLIPKAVVAEARPPAGSIAHTVIGDAATLSYPSGHVVFAVTFTVAAVLVARRGAVRAIVAAVGILFVLVTAWSRLYVGAHYGTDIVGAVLAGLAGALTIAWLWNVVAPRVARRFSGAATDDKASPSASPAPRTPREDADLRS
ncbi:phosphatase PAP2 family protein [Humibacter ginsenosidimutans]|nr:phosphatase PAP2 family protein [Humibacter ginsenosidimutans]